VAGAGVAGVLDELADPDPVVVAVAARLDERERQNVWQRGGGRGVSGRAHEVILPSSARAGVADRAGLRYRCAVPFREILQTLVDSHSPAVRAAIFCDHEGERVDASAYDVDAFELDIAGATFAATAQTMSAGQRLRVVVGDEVFWIVVVDLGCYLVVWCRKGHDGSCRASFPTIAEALATYM